MLLKAPWLSFILIILIHKYDKVAMKQVTEALGHSRIDVIADHYLHI